MDTPTARAIRASIIDRASMGDEAALAMSNRALKMAAFTLAAISVVVLALIVGKKKCTDCGKEAITDVSGD